jgi:hypothetical protein
MEVLLVNPVRAGNLVILLYDPEAWAPEANPPIWVIWVGVWLVETHKSRMVGLTLKADFLGANTLNLAWAPEANPPIWAIWVADPGEEDNLEAPLPGLGEKAECPPVFPKILRAEHSQARAVYPREATLGEARWGPNNPNRVRAECRSKGAKAVPLVRCLGDNYGRNGCSTSTR